MLLQRLRPGRPLSQLGYAGDEEATRILASLLPRIHHSLTADGARPCLHLWGSAFEEGPGQLPGDLFEAGRSRFARLLESTSRSVLLHGDLHHGNVLRHGAGWKVVDPRGVVGDPIFDLAPLFYNPWPTLLSWPNPRAVLERRLHQLAQLTDFPAERILDWALAQAVLSAVWCQQDGQPMDYALDCARLLQGLTS